MMLLSICLGDPYGLRPGLLPFYFLCSSHLFFDEFMLVAFPLLSALFYFKKGKFVYFFPFAGNSVCHL